MTALLHDLLVAAAARRPDHVAVEDPARARRLSYRELDVLSDQVRDLLLARGVARGDRVGVCGKSIPVLAAIFGILKAGAAYVPADAAAPPQRTAGIFADCAVKAVFAERARVPALAAALHGASPPAPVELAALARFGPDLVLIDGPQAAAPAAPLPAGVDLAYILYTSGSTGRPKGVVHTHKSALSFVDWCAAAFTPTARDRFSSHAPFHFDLSILDIYVPLMHGATLVLIEEELGKHPSGLASVIAEQRISVWYSTPSILRLLVEYGQLDRFAWPDLRLVLFAGEVFPIKYLNRLLAAWPDPRYFNLYGPTETNVCTFYEVPGRIAEDRAEPFPIGKACSGDRTAVLAGHGEVKRGEEGELCVSGGSVMVGYWNMPDKTAAAFVTRGGERWYRTGDVVVENDDGDYVFLGRRDRMTKRRGYRIELGEIEAVLHTHPAIMEAAVVAQSGADGDVAIRAFVSCPAGERLSLLELKAWCAHNLPRYMIPDRFTFQAALPKTSTDKTDYQALKTLD